ncbi:1327_t:CDS:2, partial [Acaulospora morrowiae]
FSESSYFLNPVMESLLTKRSLSFILLFLSILIASSNATSISSFPRKRDYEKNYYYAIILVDEFITPHDVEILLNVHYEEQIGALENHYLFSSPKKSTRHRKLTSRSLDVDDDSNDRVLLEYEKLKKKRHSSPSVFEKKTVATIDGIISVEKQKLRKRFKRVPPPSNFDNPLGIKDPGFSLQWHLKNTQEKNDINVTGVWKEGITGKGVVAAIVDDGLDLSSDDLADNFFAEGSYDFNDHNPLPRPRLSDDTHGTRCAGEIAAVKNDVCGVGVAPDAKIAGIRILSGRISDADEATALNYEFQKNHIYSCSWGPPDDGQSAEAPKGLILKAIIKGIKEGRGGKGSIYVFASGNGGAVDDNCNYDGYTNSLYTVTVGAID